MILEFNPEKHFLGKPCKKNLEHIQADGRSIRYKTKSHQCVLCKKVYDAKRLADPEVKKKRSENHKNWVKNNPEHVEAYKKEYREKNLDKLRQKSLDWYYANREEYNKNRLQYARERHQRLKNEPWYINYKKEYRLKNLDRLRAKCRAYHKENAFIIAQKKKAYRKTPKGKLVRYISCINARLKRRENGVFHQFTADQLKVRFDLFNNHCAYCGMPPQFMYRGKPEADHFISVIRGGKHSLDNIIPACRSCNGSKRHSDPHEWYSKQPFYSPDRWQYILNVLGDRSGKLFCSDILTIY